jgi:hypothetical protein
VSRSAQSVVESTLRSTIFIALAIFADNPRRRSAMKMKMKNALLSLAAAACLTFASVPSAHAANFAGRITLVQVTGIEGTLRFFVSGSGLSLFASGDFKDVLLHAFYQKANVSVGYNVITCPGGITGTCGAVFFVTVHESGF